MEDSILEKLRAIKALMEDGAATPGEKGNARRLFYALLTKNGLSEQDLVSEETDYYAFDYKNAFERRLIVQIVHTVTDGRMEKFLHGNPYTGRPSKVKLWFEITKLEYKEAALQYKYYRKALADEFDKMYSAFLHTNHIFPKTDSGSDHELTPEERKRLLEIVKLMQAMNKVDIPHEYPALEAGKK